MTISEVENHKDAIPSDDISSSDILDLLIHVAALLFVNGQTTERTIRSVEDLAEAFGHRASVFLHWGELHVHITHMGRSLSSIVAASPTAVDMGKVAEAMRAIGDARRGGLTPVALRSRVTAVEQMPSVSIARFAIMAAAGAAALGVIFGAEHLLTLVVIAATAGVGAWLRRAVGQATDNAFAQPFCAALLAGIVGAIAAHLRLDVEQGLVVACPCMVLVPGPHLLNGTIDLMRARIAIGFARVVFASVIVLAICAGLLIGLSVGGISLSAVTTAKPASLIGDVVAAGVAVAAFGSFFSMPWRFLPIPVAIGMAAHASRWLVISTGLGSVVTGALVACMIVGTIVTPVSHRLRLPFGALAFASVVSLIPGVFLFQMASSLVTVAAHGWVAPIDLLPEAVSNAMSAFLIMLAMTVGVIVPKMLIDHFWLNEDSRRPSPQFDGQS
jgi:uncharacterized membrane protein YjjP (DUF1212 family)